MYPETDLSQIQLLQKLSEGNLLYVYLSTSERSVRSLLCVLRKPYVTYVSYIYTYYNNQGESQN